MIIRDGLAYDSNWNFVGVVNEAKSDDVSVWVDPVAAQTSALMGAILAEAVPALAPYVDPLNVSKMTRLERIKAGLEKDPYTEHRPKALVTMIRVEADADAPPSQETIQRALDATRAVVLPRGYSVEMVERPIDKPPFPPALAAHQRWLDSRNNDVFPSDPCGDDVAPDASAEERRAAFVQRAMRR